MKIAQNPFVSSEVETLLVRWFSTSAKAPKFILSVAAGDVEGLEPNGVRKQPCL